MSKLLPILVLIVLSTAAIAATPILYSKYSNKPQVQGLQETKPVMTIAGTNIAVTSIGTTRQANQQDSKLPKLFATDTQLNIAFAASLAYELQSSDFQVAHIRILDRDTVGVYNQEDIVGIFSASKDVKVQIDSLQKTLALAKMNATKIAKIDLRYDKPTITLSK